MLYHLSLMCVIHFAVLAIYIYFDFHSSWSVYHVWHISSRMLAFPVFSMIFYIYFGTRCDGLPFCVGYHCRAYNLRVSLVPKGEKSCGSERVFCSVCHLPRMCLECRRVIIYLYLTEKMTIGKGNMPTFINYIILYNSSFFAI